MSLLDAPPSPFHAVAECSARLTAAGGSELSLADEWDSSSVDGFRFVRRDGALIAWKTPTTLAPAPDMLLVGAHTDSPCFKLKPNPDVQHYGWHQLAVEVYGGILNNSWLDRDLGLAGRVVNDAGETTLVRTDAIARIPQLAIHLDRGVNEGFALTLRPTSCRSGASTKWESRLLNTYSVSRVLTQLHGGMFRSSTLSPQRVSARHVNCSPRADSTISSRAGLRLRHFQPLRIPINCK